MQVVFPKLAAIVIILVGASVLGGLGQLDGDAVQRIYLFVGGYVLGNGVAARHRDEVRPVFERRPE